MSQWADKYAVLSAESAAEPGKWATLPYQKAMMDAFTAPEVEEIIVRKSSRVGFTKVLDNIIGYCIHQEPCSVLVVQPTGSDAEGYSKDEIAPMLRDTPVLTNLVADDRSRSKDNTIAKKIYPGGILNLIGAHSAAGFRRLTCRVVLFDEVDGYPPMAGKEGDQISLGKRRAQDFHNRKYVAGSSPTTKGVSKIEAMFNASSRGYYMVPCPDCKEFHIRKFSDRYRVKMHGKAVPQSTIHWEPDRPETAAWVCPACGSLLGYESHRWQVENGYWQGEDWAYRDGQFTFEPGFKGKMGFEIWAGYSFSPNCTPIKLAEEFLDSQGTPERLQTFVNTILGETWEDLTSGVDPHTLADSASFDIGLIPEDVVVVTAGVDTQGDRLSVQKVGWGWNGILVPYVLDWVELPGDPALPETWQALLDHIHEPLFHPFGVELTPRVTIIDSGGHHTTQVYNFAFENRQAGFVAGRGKGGSGPILVGAATKVDYRANGKVIKGGAAVWNMHVDTAKSWIFNRLRADTDQQMIHFARGLDGRYFQQLTAEHFDRKLRRWVRHQARNEALDTLVYALAAAHHPWLRLDQKKEAWFDAQSVAMRENRPLGGAKISLKGSARFGVSRDR